MLEKPLLIAIMVRIWQFFGTLTALQEILYETRSIEP